MFLPILISRLPEIQKIRARTWGFLFSPGSRLRGRHNLFYTGVEIRESDRGERDPEYPARYFDDRRVSSFW